MRNKKLQGQTLFQVCEQKQNGLKIKDAGRKSPRKSEFLTNQTFISLSQASDLFIGLKHIWHGPLKTGGPPSDFWKS